MCERTGLTFAKLAAYWDEEDHLRQRTCLVIILFEEADVQLPGGRDSLLSFILQGQLPSSAVAVASRWAAFWEAHSNRCGLDIRVGLSDVCFRNMQPS